MIVVLCECNLPFENPGYAPIQYIARCPYSQINKVFYLMHVINLLWWIAAGQLLQNLIHTERQI